MSNWQTVDTLPKEGDFFAIIGGWMFWDDAPDYDGSPNPREALENIKVSHVAFFESTVFSDGDVIFSRSNDKIVSLDEGHSFNPDGTLLDVDAGLGVDTNEPWDSKAMPEGPLRILAWMPIPDIGEQPSLIESWGKVSVCPNCTGTDENCDVCHGDGIK